MTDPIRIPIDYDRGTKYETVTITPDIARAKLASVVRGMRECAVAEGCDPEDPAQCFFNMKTDRDDARADLAAMTERADTQRAERLAGLLKEIRWDLGDVDGLPQDEYNCLLRRIDAALGEKP